MGEGRSSLEPEHWGSLPLRSNACSSLVQTRTSCSISLICKMAVINTIYYNAWNIMSISELNLLGFAFIIFAIILKTLMSTGVDTEGNSISPFSFGKKEYKEISNVFIKTLKIQNTF